MEVLAAVGSVVGIAGFGIQLSHFLNRYLNVYHNAPFLLRVVLESIDSNNEALQEVRDLLETEANNVKSGGKAQLFSVKALKHVKKTSDKCLVTFWRIESAILREKPTDDEIEKRLVEFHTELKQTNAPVLLNLNRELKLSRFDRWRWTFSINEKLKEYSQFLDRRHSELILMLQVITLGVNLSRPNLDASLKIHYLVEQIPQTAAQSGLREGRRRRQSSYMYPHVAGNYNLPPWTDHSQYSSYRNPSIISEGRRYSRERGFPQDEHILRLGTSRRRSLSTSQERGRPRPRYQGMDRRRRNSVSGDESEQERRVRDNGADPGLPGNEEDRLRQKILDLEAIIAIDRQNAGRRDSNTVEGIGSKITRQKDAGEGSSKNRFTNSPTRISDDEGSMFPQRGSIYDSAMNDEAKGKPARQSMRYQKPSVIDHPAETPEEGKEDEHIVLSSNDPILSFYFDPAVTNGTQSTELPPRPPESKAPNESESNLKHYRSQDGDASRIASAVFSDSNDVQPHIEGLNSKARKDGMENETKLVQSPNDVPKSLEPDLADLESPAQIHDPPNQTPKFLHAHTEIEIANEGEPIEQESSEAKTGHKLPLEEDEWGFASYTKRARGKEKSKTGDGVAATVNPLSFQPTDGENEVFDVESSGSWGTSCFVGNTVKNQNHGTSDQLNGTDLTSQPSSSPVKLIKETEGKFSIWGTLNGIPQAGREGAATKNSVAGSQEAQLTIGESSSTQKIFANMKASNLGNDGFQPKDRPIFKSVSDELGTVDLAELEPVLPQPNEDLQHVTAHKFRPLESSIDTIPRQRNKSKDSAPFPSVVGEVSVIHDTSDRSSQPKPLATAVRISSPQSHKDQLLEESTPTPQPGEQVRKHRKDPRKKSPTNTNNSGAKHISGEAQLLPEIIVDEIDDKKRSIHSEQINATRLKTSTSSNLKPWYKTIKKYQTLPTLSDNAIADDHSQGKSIFNSSRYSESSTATGLPTGRFRTGIGFVRSLIGFTRTRDGFYEDFFSAFVIKGGQAHEIPCKGRFDLGRLNITSKNNQWWKQYAFLDPQDLGALKGILETDEHVEKTLIELKYLRKDRLQVRSSGERVLIAVVKNEHLSEWSLRGQKSERQSKIIDKNLGSDHRKEKTPDNYPPPLQTYSTGGIKAEIGGISSVEDAGGSSIRTTTESLVHYAAYTIEVLNQCHLLGDPASFQPICRKEAFSEADIKKRISSLNTAGPDIIDKKFQLLKSQNHEVDKVLRNLSTSEDAPGFTWSLAQLDYHPSTVQSLLHITIYLMRIPLHAAQDDIQVMLNSSPLPAPQFTEHSDAPAEPSRGPPPQIPRPSVTFERQSSEDSSSNQQSQAKKLKPRFRHRDEILRRYSSDSSSEDLNRDKKPSFRQPVPKTQASAPSNQSGSQPNIPPANSYLSPNGRQRNVEPYSDRIKERVLRDPSRVNPFRRSYSQPYPASSESRVSREPEGLLGGGFFQHPYSTHGSYHFDDQDYQSPFNARPEYPRSPYVPEAPYERYQPIPTNSYPPPPPPPRPSDPYQDRFTNPQDARRFPENHQLALPPHSNHSHASSAPKRPGSIYEPAFSRGAGGGRTIFNSYQPHSRYQERADSPYSVMREREYAIPLTRPHMPYPEYYDGRSYDPLDLSPEDGSEIVQKLLKDWTPAGEREKEMEKHEKAKEREEGKKEMEAKKTKVNEKGKAKASAGTDDDGGSWDSNFGPRVEEISDSERESLYFMDEDDYEDVYGGVRINHSSNTALRKDAYQSHDPFSPPTMSNMYAPSNISRTPTNPGFASPLTSMSHGLQNPEAPNSGDVLKGFRAREGEPSAERAKLPLDEKMETERERDKLDRERMGARRSEDFFEEDDISTSRHRPNYIPAAYTQPFPRPFRPHLYGESDFTIRGHPSVMSRDRSRNVPDSYVAPGVPRRTDSFGRNYGAYAASEPPLARSRDGPWASGEHEDRKRRDIPWADHDAKVRERQLRDLERQVEAARYVDRDRKVDRVERQNRWGKEKEKETEIEKRNVERTAEEEKAKLRAADLAMERAAELARSQSLAV